MGPVAAVVPTMAALTPMAVRVAAAPTAWVAQWICRLRRRIRGITKIVGLVTLMKHKDTKECELHFFVSFFLGIRRRLDAYYLALPKLEIFFLMSQFKLGLARQRSDKAFSGTILYGPWIG